MYGAALKGVVTSLQSNCRSADPDQQGKCKRAVEEFMVISQVAVANNTEFANWRSSEMERAQQCYNNCQITGRDVVRQCNSTCLNGLIQGIWTRVSLPEYERIARKYA